jgi:hypothetical protein
MTDLKPQKNTKPTGKDCHGPWDDVTLRDNAKRIMLYSLIARAMRLMNEKERKVDTSTEPGNG